MATITQERADAVEESFRVRYPDWKWDDSESFTVTTTSGERFRLAAPSYQLAAAIAGAILVATFTAGDDWTVPARLSTVRVTGERTKSGWFQSYLPEGVNARSSHGPAFHVM